MSKKQIKQLAIQSYTKNNLDSKKIKLIASRLSRSDLRTYVKFLKTYENQKKVTVFMPMSVVKNGKEFSKIFPNKKIIFETDPSLLVGLKVVDNDNVYELSLKNILEDLKSHINSEL